MNNTEKEDEFKFVLVDDDPINNLICQKIIKRVFSEIEVVAFTNPLNGLDYILSTFDKTNRDKFVLFLDINMPQMSGWELMDHLDKNGLNQQKQWTIYILSSSVNPVDLEKSRANAHITGFAEKPLREDFVRQLKESRIIVE